MIRMLMCDIIPDVIPEERRPIAPQDWQYEDDEEDEWSLYRKDDI